MPACRTRRIRPSSPASTWRSSARPPTTSSPTGPGALRPAGDPRGELPAGAAPRGEGRRLRGAPGRRLRRRAGDPGRPGAHARRHRGDRRRRCSRAGAIPIVLGGDHSISEPDIRAVAATHGPVGLVHFDTHTDTGTEVYGVEISHGTPFYRLVEQGHLDPQRYVQIGLRGYWPGEVEFAWQAEHGITSFFMHDVRELGIARGRPARGRGRRRRGRRS